MARQNGYKATILVIALLGMALTLAGLVWVAAIQNERLDVGCKTIKIIGDKTDANEKDIITIHGDLRYIKESVDRIEKKVDK